MWGLVGPSGRRRNGVLCGGDSNQADAILCGVVLHLMVRGVVVASCARMWSGVVVASICWCVVGVVVA